MAASTAALRGSTAAAGWASSRRGLLFGFTRFGAGDGFHGGLARVDGWAAGRFCRRGLLFGFARFGAGDSGFNGGFARVDRLLRWGVFRRRRLLFGFTLGRAIAASRRLCAGRRRLPRRLRGRPAVRLCALWPGDSGFNGGFARVGGV
jgi:hypothetical protein